MSVLPTTIRQAAPEREKARKGVTLVVSRDEKPSTIAVKLPDGGVKITLNGGASDDVEHDPKFDANLALKLNQMDLGGLATTLLDGIQEDNRSRQDWLDERAEGIKLLALKIEKPNTSTAGSGSDNTSRTRHSLLLEATLRGQANARGEFLPADGPVKVESKLARNTSGGDDLAQLLEDDFNYYLTTTATEYYPDTDRMLLWAIFGGCGIKKVYRCPIRRRPVSESVDAADLIVSNSATDFANADRVTHKVKMRQSVMKRMQHLKVYRKVYLGTPSAMSPDVVEEEKREVTGVMLSQRPEDQEHTLYECYCMIDVPGDEHKERGEPTGLPRPYKVTIDETSREILEIRRNWKKSDDMERPRRTFVKWPYVPGFGFYDIGLVHIAGNATVAATALQRIMIDAGIYGNFPGFLFAKTLAHQNTLDLNVGPGQGMPIDTSSIPDGDIRKAIMNMPYKEPGVAMFQLFQDIVTTGSRVAGTADIAVGEGRQDAPVGTTIALIEQATKVTDAVHKRFHSAQAEEFQLLRDLFLEYPEDFYKFNQDRDNQWDSVKLTQALRDYNLTPRSDPNTSSNMQRVMRAQALYQMAVQNQALFNIPAVADYILRTLGVRNPASFLNPAAMSGQPPAPDPKSQADLLSAQAQMQDSQTKARELQFRKQTFGQEQQSKTAEMASQQQLERDKLQGEQAKNAQDISADQASQASEQQHRGQIEAAKLLSKEEIERMKHSNALEQGRQEAALAPPPASSSSESSK